MGTTGTAKRVDEAEAVAWINGNIITMDSGRPRVTALVVRNGVIEFAGNDAEALARVGAGRTEDRTTEDSPADANGGNLRVRDFGGRTVVPGFNDNHVHAVFMADNAVTPNLAGLDERQIVEALKERYPAPSAGEVIRGYDWDYPACPNPRKEILDAAFPRNPVILIQYSGHGQWLNGIALREAGIRKGSGDPEVGTIIRDPDGEPGGVIRDLKEPPLSRKRSRASFFDRATHEKRIDVALGTFARHGITSIQDNAWYYPELYGLRSRHARGALTARVTAWSLAREPRYRRAMEAAFTFGAEIPDWLREGPVKYFLDGTFSTRNACLFEPFLDDDGHNRPVADFAPP